MNNINEEEVYEFHATITSCNYYNDETMWGVYKFNTTDDIPFYTKPANEYLFDDEINENKK